MRKLFTILACSLLLNASVARAADHADVVQRVKDALVVAGIDLNGPCGAYAITRRVAWELREEAAGTLHKPAGNQCEERAVDIIAYPDGRIVDILSDAGTTNGVMWSEGESVDPSRWRPAAPASTPTTPNPPEPPVVIPPTTPAPLPSLDLSPVLIKLDLLSRDIAVLRDELRAHDERNEGHWRRVSMFATKYVLPVVMAFFGGRAIQ